MKKLTAYASMKVFMPKQKFKTRLASITMRSTAVVASLLIVSAATMLPVVHADQFDQQIQALQQQNDQSQAAVNSLQSQASSYQDAINILQAQINAMQTAINANVAKQADLQNQITTAQAELDKQKTVLGEDIKAMYVDGQITTLEMLASSKDLSDFVDKQQYQSTVQDKIKSEVDSITQLKLQLQSQQQQVENLLKEQQQQQAQLNTAQSQQNQLLAYNEGQQAQYNSQIQANQSQIADLRAEQIAANRKLVGTGHVDFSGSCGGSYPATASGPNGNWGCNYTLDNTIDNWGMYNRECVSYTAWMVYKTYGYMPYWGGYGNANQWPGDAQAAGIPVSSVPKVNTVAIYMGGSGDPFGHAMWVKSVNGDGTITVDQYNLYYDGNFYETTIPSSGLVYIYFGG